MPGQTTSQLRSQFLRDLRDQFPFRRPGWTRFEVQLEEHPSESLVEESLELLRSEARDHALFVYQTLTVWGDQVATYSVRESLRKRENKLLHQLREFPLTASPRWIAETFAWSAYELRALTVPPGETEADRALLQQIEARWLEGSVAAAH